MTARTTRLPALRAPGAGRVPGEVGIWIFVMGDLMFALYTFDRGQAIDVFSAGQATLDPAYGAINTLLLLTSSWFVVMAMHAARDRAARPAAHFIALAFCCGGGFVAVKFLEYGEKIRAGLTLTTNDFYMYYYVLTGLHFAHVSIGLAVLAYAWVRARKGIRSDTEVRTLESCATYWHMVDVLWIILFPLVYLLG